MKKKVYYTICVVLAAVFVYSAVQISITLYRYRQADNLYHDLQNRYVSQNPQNPEPATEQTAENEPLTEQEKTESAPIQVDFAALLQENSDVIGWLYCEGTPIHYPVVQSHDNEEYLHRDLNGNYLGSGTLFADYRCPALGTSQNHIIYGHNMKNGTMFRTLVKYKEQSYYDEHPVLYYLTPDGDYKIELFAGAVIQSNSDVYNPNFGGAEEWKTILRELREQSSFASDVSVTEEDHIVTLSTCSYEFNNARYAVFGKLTALS